MSLEALLQVMYLSPLDADHMSEYVVLLAIANFVDDELGGYPSKETLRFLTHLSWRQLDKALKYLESEGLIYPPLARMRPRGGQTSNWYQLTPPHTWKKRDISAIPESLVKRYTALYQLTGESGIARHTTIREKVVDESKSLNSSNESNYGKSGDFPKKAESNHLQETRVVHVLEDEYDIYIGRGNRTHKLKKSIWANPYVLKGKGDLQSNVDVITTFRAYMQENPKLLRRVHELRGKRLGCWCKSHDEPNTPCHGDVLLEFAAMSDEQLEALAIAAESDAVVLAIAKCYDGIGDWNVVRRSESLVQWRALAKAARQVFETVYSSSFTNGWTDDLRQKCANAIGLFVASWDKSYNKSPSKPKVHYPRNPQKFSQHFLSFVNHYNSKSEVQEELPTL